MTEPTPTVSTPRPARWMREPLLHFVLAGVLLFAIDGVIASRRDDPNVITLNAGADAELHKIFADDRGRAPNDAELKALRERWFDNELLYREGLALGLDRGDSGIRERVIFKALNVVQANLQLPAPDDTTLRDWFEQHRSRYDEPPRVDFLEAVVEGKPDLAAVAAFADALNAGRADTERSGLRVFRGRPVASLPAAFGADFTARLAALPLNTWQALDSTDGPRAIRVESRSAGAPAGFEPIRERVLADWRDQRMAELRTDAVRALADKYRLRVAAAPAP